MWQDLSLAACGYTFQCSFHILHHWCSAKWEMNTKRSPAIVGGSQISVFNLYFTLLAESDMVRVHLR